MCNVLYFIFNNEGKIGIDTIKFNMQAVRKGERGNHYLLKKQLYTKRQLWLKVHFALTSESVLLFPFDRGKKMKPTMVKSV